VIAGIQWTVNNKDKYAIRVMNLSLGHPVVEPCITDPLCIAVERASASGLVVVASAGNSGKDANGFLVFINALHESGAQRIRQLLGNQNPKLQTGDDNSCGAKGS